MVAEATGEVGGIHRGTYNLAQQSQDATDQCKTARCFPSPRPSPPGRGSPNPALNHLECDRLFTVTGNDSPSPRGEGRGEGQKDEANQLLSFCNEHQVIW